MLGTLLALSLTQTSPGELTHFRSGCYSAAFAVLTIPGPSPTSSSSLGTPWEADRGQFRCNTVGV